MNRARSSFDQKPPLAVSPRRLRPRRGRPEATAAVAASGAPRTSPAPSPKETQHRRRSMGAVGESPLRTECEKISQELKAAVKSTQDDFPHADALWTIALSTHVTGVNSTPLFERGRLYDIYSARRNERLKRKMEESFEGDVEAAAPVRYSAAEAEVTVKRRSTRRVDSLRMSAPEGLPPVGRTPSLRSSLRSSTRGNKVHSSVLRSAVKYADEVGTRASAGSGRYK